MRGEPTGEGGGEPPSGSSVGVSIAPAAGDAQPEPDLGGMDVEQF